jgi:phage regulator Rha-like protein
MAIQRNLVTIGSQEIAKFAYNEVPVVTFEQIAAVHGVNAKTVQSSFREHRARFQESKHFYRLDFVEASQLLAGQGVKISPNGLTLFTEAGYLMLVKPMRDDKSWEVQEKMIEAYFRAKQIIDQGSPLDRYPELRAIADLVLSVAQARDLAQEAQVQAVRAQAQALEANATANRALEAQPFKTVAEYVFINKLERQLPETVYKACSDHLRLYCQDRNIPFRKIEVGGKRWSHEYGFHDSVYAEALPGWLKRRFAQQPLKMVPRTQEDGGA